MKRYYDGTEEVQPDQEQSIEPPPPEIDKSSPEYLQGLLDQYRTLQPKVATETPPVVNFSTDPAFVRAKPDSGKEIDAAAEEEFAKKPVEEPEIDRNKEPEPTAKVVEDDDSDAKEKQNEIDKLAEDLKGEEETQKESSIPATTIQPPQQPIEQPVIAQQAAIPSKNPLTIDFGQGSPNNLAALQDAQAQRQQILQGDQILRNANLIASGKLKAKPLDASYFDSSKLAELPVKSFEERLNTEKHDPASSISKAMKDFIAQKYGINIKGNPSAADLESISKPLYNEYVAEAKGALQAQMLKTKYEQQVGKPAAAEGKGIIPTKAEATGEEARKTVEAKGGQAKELETQKQGGREKLAKVKAETKHEEMITQLGVKTDKDIDSKVLGPRNALGMASRTIVFADKLPTLLKQYKNLNDAPPTIVSDVNQAFANLISQGVPGQQMLSKLDAANVPRNVAGFWQYLTAEPNGAGQKDLMKLMLDSGKAQQELARAQIKDYVIPTVKQREIIGLPEKDRNNLLTKHGITPDEYNNWGGASSLARKVTGEDETTKAPKANEVRRKTADGKIAIFDSTTKKFLRYE